VLGAWGEFERAVGLYEESLILSREAGSVRGVAFSLLCLGVEWRVRGDFGRVITFLEEAAVRCREAGDSALLASTLSHLGFMLLLRGYREISSERPR
jgi:hypothetical protein